MKYLQVERLGACFLDHCHIGPGPFVGPGQRVGSPVCPIHTAPEQAHSKGMRQVLVPPEDLNQPAAIVQGRVDGIRAMGEKREERTDGEGEGKRE